MLPLFGREIKAVTFDLEGTIIDLEPQHHQAHALTAREFGVTLDLRDMTRVQEEVRHFIGGPTERIAEEILALAPRAFKVEDYIKRDREIFYEQRDSLERIEPREGFLPFYLHLKSMGIPTAIGSLTALDEAMPLLEKSGLNRLFTLRNIVLKEDVKKLKPEPDVYLETAKRLGVHPLNQLVFEDSPRGVEAAVRARSIAIGMPVYGDNELAVSQLRRAGAREVCRSWKEVRLGFSLRREYENGGHKERL